MSPEKLRRKMSLCREFLAVLDVVNPGYSYFRGETLLEMASTIVELCRRATLPLKKIENRNQLLAQFQEAKEVLSEAEKILVYDGSILLRVNEKQKQLSELLEVAEKKLALG